MDLGNHANEFGPSNYNGSSRDKLAYLSKRLNLD
jgi:hypothetical protein